MLLALVVSLAALPAAQTDDPPVHVSLNSDGEFRLGEKPRVYVRVEQDGHLVVLHTDRDGRVRVLFPLEPTDDDFVRGDRELEVRGRSGRQPFFLDYEGGGTVLAARSADPFTFEKFVRGDHWDYRALGASRQAVRDDPEAALLDIARQMAGDARFDYDVVPYTVSARFAYRPYGHHPYGSRFSFGLSFGYPYRYGYGFYRPFYYRSYFDDPFCYDPFWGYDPFCHRSGLFFSTGLYSTGFYPRRYYGGGFGYPVRIGGRSSRYFVPKNRALVPTVEPRRRLSGGQSFGNGSSAPSRERPSRAVEPRRRDEAGSRPSASGGGRRVAREGGAVRPSSRSGGSARQPSRGSSGGSRPAPRPSGTRRRH
ncbi:MAG: DUF4384 domain-containing protein [Gemmatimonadales bacterium]